MPAALSGPRGLRCWGKYPGAFPRFSAFSPGRRGAGCARSLVRPGRSALPETVPRGEAIHISAPLSLGCARSLVRPIFSLYHAPGLFPCLFILPLAGPASHPAYAPAATSPARYSAGRAKQHNHARNVKLLPPRGSPRRAVLAASSGQSFCAAHSTMPRGSSPALSLAGPAHKPPSLRTCYNKPGAV